MDELVLLKHAKSYIEQLSQGIDPISGQKVPNDTVLSQERLLKCFTYVGNVLQDVVEEKEKQEVKEETAPPMERDTTPRPFTITPEQLIKVPISDDPVRLSQFCQTVTESGSQTGMLPLEEEKVADWLESQGYLTFELQETGGKKRVTTEQGEEIGIETIGGLLPFSSKTITTYHTKAQHFLLEHLLEILS